MNVSDAVRARRTIRGFKPDPVPEEVICEIIDIARHAPSNSNTQPWHIAVVSGEARDRLESRIFADMEAGQKPNPFWPPGGSGLKGEYKQRQYDCAYRYYDALGIERDDKVARMEDHAPPTGGSSVRRTLPFCPCLKPCIAPTRFDIGIFLQTIMLLMVERGISSCPQGALAAYPEPVKEIAGIPEGNAILCGLSFGYEDESAAANSARMDREPFETIARITSQ